ncbi:MAG: SGNH/GDSL hydrolase family protein [Lachnospiraceae bacterium]|nr:SGNH/GDSL hydrolase family protein [Lachnospiraceae bacterium]
MSRIRKLKKWIRRNRRSLIAAGGMMLAVAIALCAILYFAENGAEPEKKAAGRESASGQSASADTERKPAGNELPDEDDEKATPTPVPVLVEPPDSPVVLKEAPGTHSGYLKHCVFLGDSRMVGMVNYACISDEDALAQVGISHNSVENFTFSQNSGKEYTVRSYLAARNPEVVYLGFGVNGMNYMDEETYKKTYRSLIEHIMQMSPSSKLVLMAIWPVDDDGPYKGAVKTEWVDRYNDFFLSLAEEKGQYYLAVNSVLQDANGRIRKEYDGGDGLHYNAAACKVIMNYIQTHPVPGVSDEGEYVVHYVAPPPGQKVTPTPPPTQAAAPTEGEEEEEEELSPTLKPSPSATVSANSPTPTKKPKASPSPEEPEPSEEEPSPTEETEPSVEPTAGDVTPSEGEKPSGGETPGESEKPGGGDSPGGDDPPDDDAVSLRGGPEPVPPDRRR